LVSRLPRACARVLSPCRFIINDSYHVDLVLVHSPHVLAIAALVLALGQLAGGEGLQRDAAGFLAGLNMLMPAVSAAARAVRPLGARG
jgi:hypothetical protein